MLVLDLEAALLSAPMTRSKATVNVEEFGTLLIHRDPHTTQALPSSFHILSLGPHAIFIRVFGSYMGTRARLHGVRGVCSSCALGRRLLTLNSQHPQETHPILLR